MNKEMNTLKSQAKELQQKNRQVYKDLQQNEIMHEKESYKLLAKAKEYKYIIHE